jgi:Family of unknown function (DUF6282)
MSDTTTGPSVDVDEIREIVKGAIDLYVHPAPELLPRTVGVVELAQQMKSDGFAGAMLWNQFSQTGEVAEIVTKITGFRLYGSIILNGTVGGLNPRVVEHAIRMGSRYVCLPSLSGTASMKARAAAPTGYSDKAIALAGPVPLLDADGNLLPEVHQIIDLVQSYEVALGLGYIAADEARAVLDVVQHRRVKRVAVLRPLVGLGFTRYELAAAMEIPGVLFQIPASSLRHQPVGRLSTYEDMLVGPHEDARLFAEAIKQYGAHRAVLTSDTGWNEATALQWVQAGAEALAQCGVTGAELSLMLHEAPAELINVG